MSVAKGLRAVARSPSVKNAVTADTLTAVGYSPTTLDTSETAARKLSAVDRCIEILSDSMAKLPTYCVDRVTRERVELPLLRLLNIRPNEATAGPWRLRTWLTASCRPYWRGMTAGSGSRTSSSGNLE